MKKNIISLLVLLLTAATGAWADEVTIGDPNADSNNQYLPSYSLYNFSLTQQIYTANEIGMAGTINALTMWLLNTSSYARNFNIYMKEVDKSVFATNSDWVSMTDDDLVATGTLTNGIKSFTAKTFTLTKPFNYSGEGNLVICFADVTGSWSSGVKSITMKASGNQAMYHYNDYYMYNVTTPNVNGNLADSKSVVRLDIEKSGLTVDTNEHGSLKFTDVEGHAITGAAKGDKVTVTIKPELGWVPTMVTVKPYTKFEEAHARGSVPATSTTIDIVQPFDVEVVKSVVEGELVFSATFTMAEDNTEISVTYIPAPVLTLAVNDSKLGTVTVIRTEDELPLGINVKDASQNTYYVIPGISVPLKATAVELYCVARWTGGENTPITGATYSDYLYQSYYPSTSTVNVTVESDTTVTAVFSRSGYRVDVPAGSFITYYSESELTLLPDETDCALYTVATVTDEEAILTEPIAVMPAETPLLIYNGSDAAKNLLLVVSPEASTPVDVAPEFRGTLVELNMDGNLNSSGTLYYACNHHDFVWVRDAGTLAANRCWIQLSQEAARNLRIVFSGEATGVKDVKEVKEVNADSFYDLNGRKVSTPKRKGVYIQNGQKVVIK